MRKTDPKPSDPPPSAPVESDRIADFEKSLDELETLVGKMEQGEQSLDDSLKSYERGVALYRNCRSALEQAELRVKLLSDPEQPDQADDFEPEAP
ncbi:MAG: exodeoxyribonuclease VII small subunit [Proteobacteria bacterium]|nr:exodeoxyribonuclease VII small subunit [Pseudomonadota bacterium]